MFDAQLSSSSRSKKIACLCGVVALAISQPLSSRADISLTDGTSSVNINPGGGVAPVGMNSWAIANQNQLNQQWFWYRVDNVALLDMNQTIDSISSASVNTYDGTRGARVLYANSYVSVLVDYHLTGVSSLQSQIGESVTVQNVSAIPLTFHFFQYSDFNLGGTLNGDSGGITQNTFTGKYNVADQTKGAIAFQETVQTPGADAASIHMPASTIAGLLGTTSDLDNSIGSTGPGNVSYAFEWNVTLAPGAQLLIGPSAFLNLNAVPEPSSLALISLGVVGVLARRRSSK
jgi:hypothetical protein